MFLQGQVVEFNVAVGKVEHHGSVTHAFHVEVVTMQMVQVEQAPGLFDIALPDLVFVRTRQTGKHVPAAEYADSEIGRSGLTRVNSTE